jgi:hypothetical protein
MNRSLVKAKGNMHKGRPIGLLVAWLFSDRALKADHTKMVKTKDQNAADRESLSHESRTRAREWARNNGLSELFEKERPRRQDSNGLFLEPEEPLGLA